MCFSTAASFGAAALLSGASGVAATKVKSPAQWAFAAIPGIFGIQQFSEGFVWLALTNEGFAHWAQRATFMFLLFAEVVWPVWLPLSMALMEKKRRQKRILLSLLGLGLVFSMHALYGMLVYPYSATIADHHIQYYLNIPLGSSVFLISVYIMATLAPTFFSSVPRMWMMGLPIAISLFIARYLYPDYIISVWCFFAAIISLVVVYILLKTPSVESA